MKKHFKRILIALSVLIVIHYSLIYIARSSTFHRKVTFAESQSGPVDTLTDPESTSPADLPPVNMGQISPFSEITPFDSEAHHWSHWASQYGGAGILTFDANGDDKVDVYLLQDSRNWVRASDDNAVLKEGPTFQRNLLYLNQGNDPSGNPLFQKASDLASANDTYTEEELLLEDFLFPRKSPTDSKEKPGRKSNVAVAADFNNDGLIDVYVGNEMVGMKFSHPKTQQRMGQLINPIDREARETKSPVESIGVRLINYKPTAGMEVEIESSRGKETEGANSLYLNMGDKDNDGLPEWKDVSRSAGVEGFGSTYSISVADFDLDGDLDIYTGNTGDLDFFPNSAKELSGGANCLYLNQIAESGDLVFQEKASDMDVDGVYDADNPVPPYYKLTKLPFLPIEYSILLHKPTSFRPEFLEIDGQVAEPGQISWASTVQDVNADGFPDIWVANDLGFLRLYLNQAGKHFIEAEHSRSALKGAWMSIAPADFNLDGTEDFLGFNLGGGVFSHGFVTPPENILFSPTLGDTMAFGQFFNATTDYTHALIDGRDVKNELKNTVHHSRILPPDGALPNNQRRYDFAPGSKSMPFEPESLDPYEFSWGATPIDVQNDGKPDLYFHGCLFGRGGGLWPVIGTNPGRLLVNTTAEKEEGVQFADLTAEYQLFNIEELQYDSLDSKGFIYRKSPSQNWPLRDMVYSFDKNSWVSQGLGIQEKITNQNLIQTAENGRAVISTDLNNDGFSDLVLRNSGGYDSRSSNAKNLQTRIDGKLGVVPAHNYHYPSPTNYEPGRTRVFINQHNTNHWIKIKLLLDTPDSFNRDAIGAIVRVNDHQIAVKRVGSGSFISNKAEDLHFGLAGNTVNKVTVTWPDKERATREYPVENLKNGRLIISKSKGVLRWEE